MALIKRSTADTHIFGMRTNQNMLKRNGEYYIFFVSYNGIAYANYSIYYRRASTLEGLVTASDTECIQGYKSTSTDLYNYVCSAYTFKYDPDNDTILFVTSNVYPGGTYPTYLRTTMGRFDGNGDIVLAQASPYTEINSDTGGVNYYGYANICKLNSGKWAILNCEDIDNVNPFSEQCKKINAYVSDVPFPTGVANWSSGNLVTSAAYDISTATAISPVDDSSDDFVVTYITQSGSFYYVSKSKRWVAASGAFNSEVDIGTAWYYLWPNAIQTPYLSNMAQDASGVPHFVRTSVNTLRDGNMSSNSDICLLTYDEPTDSWSSEVQPTGVELANLTYPYVAGHPAITYVGNDLFMIYAGNRTTTSNLEANLAIKRSGVWTDITEYLGDDIGAEDQWSSFEAWPTVEEYEDTLLIGFGWRNRFGAPDHIDLYMREAAVSLFAPVGPSMASFLQAQAGVHPILTNTRISPYNANSSDNILLKLDIINNNRLLNKEVTYDLYANYNGGAEIVASGTTNRYGKDNINLSCSGIPDINACQFLVNATYNNIIYSSNITRVNFK